MQLHGAIIMCEERKKQKILRSVHFVFVLPQTDSPLYISHIV